jgi:hypothetical protein
MSVVTTGSWMLPAAGDFYFIWQGTVEIDVSALGPGCGQLQTINLRDCKGITELGVTALGQICGQLQSIGFACRRNITGIGVSVLNRKRCCFVSRRQYLFSFVNYNVATHYRQKCCASSNNLRSETHFVSQRRILRTFYKVQVTRRCNLKSEMTTIIVF